MHLRYRPIQYSKLFKIDILLLICGVDGHALMYACNETSCTVY